MNVGGDEIMYYVAIILVTLILCTIALKYIQVVRLLFRLGFKYDVLFFLVLVLVLVGLSIALIVGNNFTTTGFVIGGLLSGILLPSMFEMTRKKKNSGYGKKRPKHVSDTDHAWSYYGGSASSDCGDAGSGGDGGGDGGSCD